MMDVIKNGAAGTDVVVKSSVGMGEKETTMTQNVAQTRQKAAFLTGASSGIGRATAVALAKTGYRVIDTSQNAKADAPRNSRGAAT